MLKSLIKKYQETFDNLKNTYSGKQKFLLITSYLGYCENKLFKSPPIALAEEFIPVLVDVILKNDINFISPEKVLIAKNFLKDSEPEIQKLKHNEIILEQIGKANDILNIQLLKLNFYVGNLEEGIGVLKNIVEETNNKYKFNLEGGFDKSIIELPQGTIERKYSLVHADTFREIKVFEVLKEIKTEFEKLNSNSDSNINALLIEQSNLPDLSDEERLFGNVLSLKCQLSKPVKKHKPQVTFENITNLDEHTIEYVLKDIRLAAIKGIEFLKTKTINRRALNKNGNRSKIYKKICNFDVSLKFENIKSVYEGESFGLAASVLIICNYFSFTNSIIRYKINNSAAFTGIVNREGDVIPVNPKSIKAKVTAAFFSWIKYCVIPKENYYDALNVVNDLKSQYPNKKFELIPVSNVSEVFDSPEVIIKEKLSNKQFVKNFINRHKIPVSVLFAIFIFLLSFFLANKFLPRDIKPISPLDITSNYLIYTPDRDTSWIFVNRDFYGGDTINFGDVAIGDYWTPRLRLINNSRESEYFSFEIKGKDKEEFEITWFLSNSHPDFPNKLNPDVPLSGFIKFVPHKTLGEKEAYLEVTSNKTGKSKIVYLRGNSKKLDKGYSLALINPDDDIVFEPIANILNDNFTVSFWVKPFNIPKIEEHDVPKFFQSDNNPLSNNKLRCWISNDSLLQLIIYPSKSREIPEIIISSKTKVKIGEWNFVAISYKDSIISLILNDEVVFKNIGINSLRKINDCLYFNTHPSLIERKEFSSLNYQRYIDLFCIYNRGINPFELIRNKYQVPLQKENGLILCWDFNESNANQVFDKTPNDYWPKYFGGVNRVIDKPPLKWEAPKQISHTKSNTVFKRIGNGVSRLNKSLFSSKSSFTIQCDFKIDSLSYTRANSSDKQITPFFINRGGLDFKVEFNKENFYLQLMDDYRKFFYSIPYENINKFKWNRFTLVYDLENNLSYVYLNGDVIIESPPIPVIIDITENYMGISFGFKQYYADPRFFGPDTYIDNIKIYNRVISPQEVYSENSEGLLAYWTFENIDNNVVFDVVNKIPLILFEPYELVGEEINMTKYQPSISSSSKSVND